MCVPAGGTPRAPGRWAPDGDDVNAFLQMLRGLGPMRLAAIAGVGVSILGFFIYLMSRVAAPQMELLYGDLDLGDSKQIIEKLTADKIPYELRKDGTEVWVPKDRKLDLRVRMAEQALPAGGRMAGYELFDKQDALGSTSFQQNITMVRALEGELSKTIRSIDRVKAARVHLVLPKREAFSRDTQEPSASVIIKMNGAQRLDKGQVSAIQHLIAAAVPKMKPSRISIVDDKGTLLAKGFENSKEYQAQTAEEMKVKTEAKLVKTIEDLLERSLGPGRVRAEVTVDMDMSQATTTEETFDPETKVVRSQVTVNEGEQSQDAEPTPVTVQQNLPDPNASSSGNIRTSTKINKNQETVNYEISRKTKSTVREMGEIRKVSAAVIVDGVREQSADGKQTSYRERTAEELSQIEALVKSAIGYTKDRDDQVKVASMPFYKGEELLQAEEPGEFIFGMRRDFVEKIASNLGLSVVAILFLLLVLRPLISRAIESMQGQVGPDGRRLLTTDGGAMPQLTGPGAAAMPAPLGGEEEVIADELIDIDKVEGRVKASSIRKIGEIVEKHPEEALSIIRNWLYQES
ncbi:Flagellar biosynthesis/type III secretory pathway lipoprotein [Paramagnetospirillum magneticum AMB-1]|uniref:Flagellar M-ring protein n=1 Tax=Paramagnetospirillum magneticum (strain ATCC 700264 / AMB-1) TaxID=342108 RepID=Q2WA18_PARM1|nr:Flagellar biosynthesis/type III secretory pathway lipoprotein [Paramagnetospirillum magneticum AMB-1]